MYKTDIIACNKATQNSASIFRRAVLFVLATIQQQLETVPAMVSEFETLGIESRYAWGVKPAGIVYIGEHAETLHRDAVNAKDNPAELMRLFLQIPGLGLVKAGFLCQLFAGSVGCIDTHNIKLYDIPLSVLRITKKAKPETQRRKIEKYISLCDGLGGAVLLWSAWCDFVANLRPNNWENGAAVSLFHYDVISGLENGAIVDLFTGLSFEPEYKRAA